MSFLEKTPPPGMQEWRNWAEQVKKYLDKVKVVLATKVVFDKTSPAPVSQGEMAWNSSDDTMDIGHADGVVQQVGLEQYMRAENLTGSTITNGSVVGFAGVNGEIKMQKYIADGTIPSLYYIGVATQDFSDGEVGMVTTYGRVRGLDTSSFTKGDILYASPSTAGALTNVRPTAPDEVVVVAAALVIDATDGEIMVRPTIPMGLNYGSFSDTTDQTPAAANTAYAITFNTTDISRNVSVASSSQLTVAESGFYNIDVTLQVTSSNASASNVYAWLRKNGTDVANSRMDFTIKANGDTKVFGTSYQISLSASDYVQIMWAADTTSMTLDAKTATGFAPAAPSARVAINQTQL